MMLGQQTVIFHSVLFCFIHFILFSRQPWFVTSVMTLICSNISGIVVFLNSTHFLKPVHQTRTGFYDLRVWQDPMGEPVENLYPYSWVRVSTGTGVGQL